MPKPTQHLYHPVIPLAFHLSILPDDMLSRIPRSTKHDWKNKDLTRLFGFGYSIQQNELFDILRTVALNKRLLAVNRALLRVIVLKRFIQKNSALLVKKQATVTRVLLSNLQKVFEVTGFRKALRFCDLSYSKFLVMKNNLHCSSSPIRLCRRRHPSQLLRGEADAIVSVCNDPAFAAWPLASVYHLALKRRSLFCSLGTFYKYAAMLVDRRKPPPHRRKNHCTGIRAGEPLQILHADITRFVTTDDKRAYIYFIQDNFSRAVLQYKVADERKAFHTLELIRKTYHDRVKDVLPTGCSIVTDDGCENKGISPWLRSQMLPPIEHLVAQKDISFSNSMIEHLNKVIKYQYLYQQPIAGIDELRSILANAVNDYNNRPAHVLNGLIPLEALRKQTVDPAILKEQIRSAAMERILKNKSTDCRAIK